MRSSSGGGTRHVWRGSEFKRSGLFGPCVSPSKLSDPAEPTPPPRPLAKDASAASLASAVHGDICVAYCMQGYAGQSTQLQCAPWSRWRSKCSPKCSSRSEGPKVFFPSKGLKDFNQSASSFQPSGFLGRDLSRPKAGYWDTRLSGFSLVLDRSPRSPGTDHTWTD